MIRTRCHTHSKCDSVRQQFDSKSYINLLESLILAQDERWRRA